jgi:hypothetical protein
MAASAWRESSLNGNIQSDRAAFDVIGSQKFRFFGQSQRSLRRAATMNRWLCQTRSTKGASDVRFRLH